MPLGMKVGLGPGHIELDRETAPHNGHNPRFWPMSIVAKQSPMTATVEHLLGFRFVCIWVVHVTCSWAFISF